MNSGKLISEQWPTFVFVPTILVLVAVLVAVTRWWDQRDEQPSTARRARHQPGRWQGARCDCSWHAIHIEPAEQPVATRRKPPTQDGDPGPEDRADPAPAGASA